MLGTIIIAHDGSRRSAPAVALGRAFARFAAPDVVVALPYTLEPVAARSVAGADAALTRQAAWQTLDALGAELSGLPDVRYRAIAGESRVDALRAVAEQERAGLLVVAQREWGGIAERLLQGSPCPVAVARAQGLPEPTLARVAVVYDGHGPARAALGFARTLVELPGSPVRSAHVLAAGCSPADATAPPDWPVVTLPGDPARALHAASADYDLIVIAAREHGPLRRILVADAAAQLAEEGHCPVVVVPRDLTQ